MVPVSIRRNPCEWSRDIKRRAKFLRDACQRLIDHSYPQRWIVCRAVVICSADILISSAKGCHNRNSRQSLSEMTDKVASFFPRGAMPDQDDTH